MTWRDRAACRGLTDQMFPAVGEQSRNADEWERARAVCATCPVTCQCLAWAIQHREDDGMWGGCTPAERLGLRRQLRRRGAA